MKDSKKEQNQNTEQKEIKNNNNLIGFFDLRLKIAIKIIKITKLKNEKESKFSMNNPIVFIITMLILQYLLNK